MVYATLQSTTDQCGRQQTHVCLDRTACDRTADKNTRHTYFSFSWLAKNTLNVFVSGDLRVEGKNNLLLAAVFMAATYYMFICKSNLELLTTALEKQNKTPSQDTEVVVRH